MSEGTERSHCWEFVEQVEVDSDRAVAIVAGAVLDEMLKRLLSLVIVDEAIAVKLLDDYASPLRTFSARINAAYAFRFIAKEHYELLNTIRDIRNFFAHMVDWSFAESTTVGMCQNMHLDNVAFPPGEENDPRTRFIMMASAICGQIEGNLLNFGNRGFDPILLERVERYKRRRRSYTKLKEVSRDHLSKESYEEPLIGRVCSDFIDQLNDQSERAQAIVAVAALDEMLRRILNVVIADEKVSNDLVNNLTAPLATFSARTYAAYAFRIIGKELHDILHKLRDIRNPFAHQARWSFSEQSTNDKCRNLNMEGVGYIEGLENDPRHRFIMHSTSVCGRLNEILENWNTLGFDPQLLRHDD